MKKRRGDEEAKVRGDKNSREDEVVQQNEGVLEEVRSYPKRRT